MFARTLAIASALLLCMMGQAGAADRPPMAIGVVGLTHTHVHWIFGSEKRGDFKIVGIVERDKALALRYADQYGFSMDMVYDDLPSMLDAAHPVGVAAFGSIHEHLGVVRIAAPRGVHVMVEKPLAVNMTHAREMYSLAKKHKIHLLTNYETTWYPTTHKAYEMIRAATLAGPVRKMVFHHGHQGPAKIGVDKEFLDWLADPKLNGGGAIIDFGCYGANLMTWLMGNERPLSVTAATRSFQPETYPRVDDEATIIVDYPDAQGIIQASWNWPTARKDMEIYGVDGQVFADDRSNLRFRASGADADEKLVLKPREYPHDDPFSYFRAVIAGEILPADHDPSSLENNMRVVEILDAAARSARTGKTVRLAREAE